MCIGGDRTSGYAHAKQQLFRTLDDTNPDPRLAALESQVMTTINSLGVGPMGFGGGTTLIGCKVGVQNRLPASFFVSIAYDCWAFRRLGVLLDPQTGAIREWQFRDPAQAAIPMVDAAAGTQAFALTGQEKVLRAPIDEATIRSLKVGDVVLVSGRAYTGRDAVHHHLMEHEPPVDLSRRRALSLRPGGEEGGRRLARDGGRARRPASARSRTRPTSSSATASAR